MKVLVLLQFFVIIGILYVFVYEDDGTVYEYIKGTKIKVRKGRKTEQVKTANYLYSLRQELSTFIDYLVELQVPTKEQSLHLKKKYNLTIFGETPIKEKQVAYTLNKGTEIRICIKDDQGKFINKKQTIFILFHELAHIITKSKDHTEEFLKNQRILVKNAKEFGLYKKYQDSDYCGTFLPYIEDL